MIKPGNSFAEYQAEFAEFLLQVESRPQPALSARFASQACSHLDNPTRLEPRLRVYRNNVMYSLTQALAAQFPVLAKLVGAEFFTALARDYVREQPPHEPSLTFYGHLFGDFIEASPACRSLPYLADVARLELYCQYALNAADDSSPDLEQLAILQPAQLEELRVTFASSAFLFASSYPTERIWSANLENSQEEIRLEPSCGQHLLICRRDMQVQVVALQPVTFLLLQQLQQRASLGEACAQLQDIHNVEVTEFPALLSYVFALQVFSRFTLQPSREIS